LPAGNAPEYIRISFTARVGDLRSRLAEGDRESRLGSLEIPLQVGGGFLFTASLALFSEVRGDTAR